MSVSSTPRASARAPRRLALRALGGAVGGGAIAFTLMACYGAAPPPPCPDGTRTCLEKPPEGAPGSSMPLAGDGGK